MDGTVLYIIIFNILFIKYYDIIGEYHWRISKIYTVFGVTQGYAPTDYVTDKILYPDTRA